MNQTSSQQTRHIELIFFDAGGGHRAATEALAAVIATHHPTWSVVITNLQETLRTADPLFLLTGIAAQDYYNAALRMGMTYGSRTFLHGLQRAIKLCAPHMEKVLCEHWDAQSPAPDIVVSMVPNFNGIMYRALQKIRPGIPYVTVMTDLADTPPHFWMEDQDQYIICGSTRAYRQARASGFYKHEKIFQTSGMILRPSFYASSTSTVVTHESLGLTATKPTALIMFGGYGAKTAAEIVDRLNKADIGVQSLVLCGRNEDLRHICATKKNCAAVAFTRDVAPYMQLADFFIGKPGPGSMSEAWHMGLPTIVERNARTMIQERPNVEIAEEMGIGTGVANFKKIGQIVKQLIDDGGLTRMRKKLQSISNQAVYEVPALIESILSNPRS